MSNKTIQTLFGAAFAAAATFAHAADLPTGYTRLPYLQSTGSEYLDTGVVMTDAHGFHILFQIVTIGSNTGVCGSRENSGDTRCCVAANGSNGYVGWNGLTIPSGTGINVQGQMSESYLNYKNDRKAILTGSASKAVTSLATLSAQTRKFHLFRCNYSSPYGCACKIYSFRMTKNADVVMDLVPARRASDSVLGMYDTVGGKFLTNLGSGAFVDNYDDWKKTYRAIDYIESSGTQYIDTGVKMTDAHGYRLSFRATADSSNQIFAGSRTDSGNTRCIVGANGSYSGYIGWGPIAISAGSGAFVNADTVDEVNYFGSRTASDGVKSVSLGTLSDQTYSFYLFAQHNWSGVGYGSHCRIFSFAMTKDSAVILDMIPVRRKSDKVLGMYDKVTDHFFVNLGSGTFDGPAEPGLIIMVK